MNVLVHAPLWVWPLLAALIWLGLRATRPRRVAGSALFVWPAVMAVLTVFSLASTYGGAPLALASWLAGMAAAILVGRLSGRGAAGARYDAATGRFALPGSWVPLMLMLAVFASRFAIGVARARTPQLVDTPAFLAAVGLVLGALSGTFTARTLALAALRRAPPAPHDGSAGATPER
jgi:hypothetical protein